MLFLSLSSLSAVFFTFLFFVASSPAALASHAALDHGIFARSSPETWTNAQRLAAGLPPLAPRRFKRATPTEPGVPRRHAPSPSPSAHVKHPIHLAPVKTSYTGTLQARTVPGNSSLGFVRLSSSGVTLGGDNASRVTFTAVGTLPFSIATVTGGANEEPSFLGAVGKTAIASGSASAAALSNVVQTPAHARPTSSTGSESAIWTIDANTRRLTALWVNPDGSHVNTVLAHGASAGALVLTGDVDAYNRAHPDAPVSEVALYLVSN
ncbi:hypothetical protein GSI_03333 [Ganoderma sinense ZZ0214-1]|uniref:Secreted protein n=1 Tax=Ganoderma sinense ZZ0214-1 TaxID=1077348 RepID=A0A2G8SLA8_9APHY|nr:hypothetical protein GSI_03333 [Ganoderma sinense ZZ0214-1]